MSVPVTVTRATVGSELASAVVWANRQGWAIHWDANALRLRATTNHPIADRLIEVTAALEGYRALPPAWRFVVPGSDESPKAAWPAPGSQPGLPGSIFHPHPCICAPWNRLAYREHSGPHGDWAMTSWWSIPGELTKANHLADMLDQIHQHLRASPGFQT